ncbi:hypothetical protein FRB96_007391 [Tulasnella sp. 330]|nr:hypothetical protein FRB96_007391 [Tulasnella sp. 330]
MSDNAEYKEAFALFDKKGTGKVQREVLGDLLRALGQNPTQAEVAEIVATAPREVDYNTFLSILNRPDGFKPSGSADEFVRGFQVFDKEGNGFIGAGELRYVLTQLGEKMTDEEVDELMKGVQVGPDKTQRDEPPVVSTATALPKQKKLSKAQAAKKDAKTKRRMARKEAEAAHATLMSPITDEQTLSPTTTSTGSEHAYPQILPVLEVTVDMPEGQAHAMRRTSTLVEKSDNVPNFGSSSNGPSQRSEPSSPSPSETTTSTNTTSLTAVSSTFILTPPAKPLLGLDTTGQQQNEDDAAPITVGEHREDVSIETIADQSPKITAHEESTASAKIASSSTQGTPPAPSQPKTSPHRTSKPLAEQASSGQAGPSTVPTPTGQAPTKRQKPSVTIPLPMLSKSHATLITHGPHAMFERSQSQLPSLLPPTKPQRSSSQGSSGGVGLGIPSSASTSAIAGPSAASARSASTGSGSSSRASFVAPRHLRRHQEQPGQPPLNRIIQTQPGSPMIVSVAARDMVFSPPNPPSPVVAGNGMAAFYPRPVPVPWNMMYGTGGSPHPQQPGSPHTPTMFQQHPTMVYTPHHVHAPVSMYPGATAGDVGSAADHESDDVEDEDDVILVSVDDRYPRGDGDDDMTVDFPTLNPSPPKPRPTSVVLVGASNQGRGRTVQVDKAANSDEAEPPTDSIHSTPDISVGEGTLRSESRSSVASSSSMSSMGPSTKPSSIAPPTHSSVDPSPTINTKHLHPLSLAVANQQPNYPPPSYSPYTPNGGYSPLQVPHPHFMRSTSTPSPIPMMPPGWYSPSGYAGTPNQGSPYMLPTWVGPPVPTLQAGEPEPTKDASSGVSATHLSVNSGGSASRSRSNSPFVSNQSAQPPYGPPPMPMPMGYPMQLAPGQAYAYQYGPPSPYLTMSPPPMGMPTGMSGPMNGFNVQQQSTHQGHPIVAQQPPASHSRETSSSSKSSRNTEGRTPQSGEEEPAVAVDLEITVSLDNGASQATITTRSE